MPEREADKRRLELQGLQEQLGRWDKDLRDQDWIQRFQENKDWDRLGKLFREEFEPTKKALEELKTSLLAEPMEPERAVKVREAAMLMQRDLAVLENLLTFPQREAKRLSEIQREYPELKQKVRQLERALER